MTVATLSLVYAACWSLCACLVVVQSVLHALLHCEHIERLANVRQQAFYEVGSDVVKLLVLRTYAQM